MRTSSKAAFPGSVLLCLSLVAAGAAGWWHMPFSSGWPILAKTTPETVLPARIQTARAFDGVCEYGGNVKQVHVANGATVAQGDMLVTLENSEIAAELATARIRVE